MIEKKFYYKQYPIVELFLCVWLTFSFLNIKIVSVSEDEQIDDNFLTNCVAIS